MDGNMDTEVPWEFFLKKAYLINGGNMNRCFHFTLMLLDHWSLIDVSIWINVSLHT